MTKETIAKIRQAEQEADKIEQDAELQAERIEKETEDMIATLSEDAKKKNADYKEKCRMDAEEKAKEQESILLKETEESFVNAEKAGREKLPEVAKALFQHLIK